MSGGSGTKDPLCDYFLDPQVPGWGGYILQLGKPFLGSLTYEVRAIVVAWEEPSESPWIFLFLKLLKQHNILGRITGISAILKDLMV